MLLDARSVRAAARLPRPREAFAVFSTGQIVLTGVVFCLALVAFVNTLLITREDVIRPLQELRGVAEVSERAAESARGGRETAIEAVDEIRAMQRDVGAAANGIFGWTA